MKIHKCYKLMFFFFVTTLLLVFGCKRNEDHTQEDLNVNYAFPPGTLNNSELVEYHEKAEKELQKSWLPEQYQNYKELRKARDEIVDEVEKKMSDTYVNLSNEKRELLKEQFLAALRDIKKMRRIVRYDFVYVDQKQNNYVQLVFGAEQLREWRGGMFAWGVLYNQRSSVWPEEFLHTQEVISSRGAGLIAGGDWKGAWLVDCHPSENKIFIPGVKFFVETEIDILQP